MGDDDIIYKKAKVLTALDEGSEPARATLMPWQVDFTVINERLDYVSIGATWGNRWLAVFLTEAANEYSIEPDPEFKPYDHTMSTNGRKVRLDKTIRIDFDKRVIYTNLARNEEEGQLFFKVINHFITSIGNRAAAEPPVAKA